MIVKAQAKVNMALDVVGVLENGYHELDMIMAPVSIYDTIEIEKSDRDHVTCDHYEIPENNTVSKMIKKCREEFGLSSFYAVHIQKEIPTQSGMAGGSADAAAVLKAILELENIDCPLDKQIEIGKSIGADVPFCIVNKWARVQGIGEKISCLDTDLKIKALIVKPDEGVSTPAAFKLWHETKPIKVDVDLCQKAIENKDMILLVQAMQNSLEPVAKQILPVLNQIKEDMEDNGIVRVMMSGSGSSMMGFSMDDDVLEKAKQVLEKKYPFVRLVEIG